MRGKEVQNGKNAGTTQVQKTNLSKGRAADARSLQTEDGLIRPPCQDFWAGHNGGTQLISPQPCLPQRLAVVVQDCLLYTHGLQTEPGHHVPFAGWKAPRQMRVASSTHYHIHRVMVG